MKRGDIWTVAGGQDYAGKPRPVVVVQDDSFDATDSVTICAFTTDETEAPLFRLPVEPNERNGLRAACRLMVDKITTVPKTKVGARVGRLDDEDILRLNQAMFVFLGLAVSPKAKRCPGLASGARPSMILRRGPSRTIGPNASRSRNPSSMCSRHGSDDLRGQSR